MSDHLPSNVVCFGCPDNFSITWVDPNPSSLMGPTTTIVVKVRDQDWCDVVQTWPAHLDRPAHEKHYLMPYAEASRIYDLATRDATATITL